MKETLVLYSSIDPFLTRRLLFKGMLLALIGMIILLYAGVFFNLSIMQNWGLLIFLLSLALIIKGMLPYRSLIRLISNPNKLRISNELTYSSKNIETLCIPIEAIENIHYFKTDEFYGIGIELRFPYKKTSFELSNLMRKAAQRFSVDLFFPYFSERSYKELKNWLQAFNEPD